MAGDRRQVIHTVAVNAVSSIIEKRRHPPCDVVLVLRPTFPDRQHVPFRIAQRFSMSSIASLIARQLFLPVFPPRRGHSSSAFAGVHMPETAMYEDDFPPRRKHEVRLARQVRHMQSIAIPHGVRDPPNDPLRRGVFALHRRHHAGSLFRSKDIRHEESRANWPGLIASVQCVRLLGSHVRHRVIQMQQRHQLRVSPVFAIGVERAKCDRFAGAARC